MNSAVQVSSVCGSVRDKTTIGVHAVPWPPWRPGALAALANRLAKSMAISPKSLHNEHYRRREVTISGEPLGKGPARKSVCFTNSCGSLTYACL